MNSSLRLNSKVCLIKKGLWSCEEILNFYENKFNSGSKIVNDASGSTTIMTTFVDSILNGGEVTFIKLDIEGSELEALRGASESIRKYHPLLAISVYHKPSDIVDIPTYIKNLVPEYELCLRSYHEENTEIVLYAIFPENKQ